MSEPNPNTLVNDAIALANAYEADQKAGKEHDFWFYAKRYALKGAQHLGDLAVSFGSTWVPDLDNTIWNVGGNLGTLLNAYERQLAKWAAQTDTPEISRMISRATSELNNRKEALMANLKSSASKAQAQQLVKQSQSEVDTLQGKYDKALNEQNRKQMMANSVSGIISNARTSPSMQRFTEVQKAMQTAMPEFKTIKIGDVFDRRLAD